MQDDRFKTVALIFGYTLLKEAHWYAGSIPVSIAKLMKLALEEEIVKDFDQKMSEEKMAKKYECSTRTIERYRKKLWLKKQKNYFSNSG